MDNVDINGYWLYKMDKMEYHGIQHHIANSSWVGWLFQPSWKESVVAHHHRPKDWSKSNMFKATSQLSLNMANLGITDHFKHSMTISEQSLLLFIMFWPGIGEDLAIKCYQPTSTSRLIMSQFNTNNPYNIYLYILYIVIHTYSIYSIYIYYVCVCVVSFIYPSYINRLNEKNISPAPPCADFHTSARRRGSGTLDLTRRDEVADVAGPGAAGQKLWGSPAVVMGHRKWRWGFLFTKICLLGG